MKGDTRFMDVGYKTNGESDIEGDSVFESINHVLALSLVGGIKLKLAIQDVVLGTYILSAPTRSLCIQVIILPTAISSQIPQTKPDQKTTRRSLASSFQIVNREAAAPLPLTNVAIPTSQVSSNNQQAETTAHCREQKNTQTCRKKGKLHRPGIEPGAGRIKRDLGRARMATANFTTKPPMLLDDFPRG